MWIKNLINKIKQLIRRTTRYSITGDGVARVRSSELLKEKQVQTAIRKCFEITLNKE